MSTAQAPPPKKTNRVGLEVIGYRGSKTTLCAGCGHNSITERLIECFFEMGIEPWRVAKFSGIGCSSKSPAYFLGMSHGFNGVHGRAPAIATGAMLANKNLLGIVVTGDGDMVSDRHRPVHPHAAPQRPAHLHHREQRRLRADQGSVLGDLGRRREIEKRRDQRTAAGGSAASRRSRSARPSWPALFSGDKRQLQAILKAAIAHRGLSVIDVISPCVTFNDHEGSTKATAS